MSEKTCEKCGGARWSDSDGRCLDCRAAQKRDLRARARGKWEPHESSVDVPLGYHVLGTSTLRDAEGNAVLQWQKTRRDKEDQVQAVVDAVEGLVDKLPREPTIPAPPGPLSEDLLAVYPMGDPHLGLYSWAPETGENFNLEIAEAELVAAADQLVGLAPAAHTALIVNCGDFFHSDNQSNRTSRSGHSLDVDGRWAKVLAVGVRVMCRVIERALEKHETVIVRNEIGNHDDHSSVALSVALSHHYHDNPRAKIDTSPAKFWYHEHGRVLIGTTHGDTIKPAKLPGVMASDQPEAWGRTRFRHWIVGHVHHESVKEYPGCVVETFRTLAPRDAWHTAQGYRSDRDMRLDVYHKEWGLVNRHIVGIDRVRCGQN